MSEPAKIFSLTTAAGAEVLAVDAAGDFFIRGERTESTDNVRAVFLEFAKQFLLERVNNKTIVAIRSTVPAVLRQHAAAGTAKDSPEFGVAIARAQTRPLLEFSYNNQDLHPHVLVGVLQEMIHYILSTKLSDEKAAVAKAAPAPAPAAEPAPVRTKKKKASA